MSTYSILKQAYHAVMPSSTRTWLFENLPGPLRRTRLSLIRRLERGASHDEIYDATYYATKIEPLMAVSSDVMAESIVSDLAPRKVVDIGCGAGLLMKELTRRGVDAVGFEYAEAALALCRSRGLNVHRLDIERDPVPAVRADVVICTEVAEHLPASSADKLVSLLNAISPVVVFTAAVPGQGGDDHQNEQPHGYWIERFERSGTPYQPDLTARWRASWREQQVGECFANNIMVFRRRENT